MVMIEQNTEIIFNKRVASETFLMGLDSPEIVARARPGQFVMIRVREAIDPLLRRPFSICGVQDELVLLLYRVVGRGTACLADTGKGETLSIVGPLGNGFELPDDNQKILLVAGGIGIAPLLFLSKTVETGDIEFMTGFTSADEIIDPHKICDVKTRLSLATDDGTKGHAGFVTELLEEYLKQQDTGIGSVCVFTCGPLPMMKRVAALALESGISCQVSLEAFMACGLGACQGCAVRAFSSEGKTLYHHVCKDGPVFPVQAIDWNSL